jgi:hypothetical protein
MTDTAPAPAPDRPPVPRPRTGIATKVYAVIAAVVIGGWVYVGMTGQVLGDPSSHDDLPASVRASPGGYRSFHFWHSGYQGGK